MPFRVMFNAEKNILLKESRGINFDDIVEAINQKNILDDYTHHDSKKYPDQRIIVVKINNYAYAAPYVIDFKKEVIFLKTVYPSRVLTKQYLKKK